jgi:hypothetical protein
MTEEDEEFNRIEREASLRKAAVAATVQKPLHPEIRKMYEDYFDKCFREYSAAEREWTGLTDEERNSLWRVIIGWGDPSHDDIDLMKAIESTLRKKNEM